MPTVRDIEQANEAQPVFVKFSRPVRNFGTGLKRYSCDGKKPFDDLKFALLAAGRRKSRQVYRCRHCRRWHVGTRA